MNTFTWQDDEHLADLFREADKRRWKINWWPLLGALAVMLTFAGFVGFCIWGYYRVTGQ